MKRLALAPHSLRGRLTLWHCVILGLGLVAFTVAGYGLVARSLIGEIDRSLVERAQPIHGMLLGETRPAVEPRIIVPPPTSFASAGIFVQVTTPEGNVLNVAADPGIVGLPLARLPVTAMLHTAVSVDQPQFRTVRLGGEQVRLYSMPLIVDGQTVGIVHVGRALEAVERSLSRLRIFAGGGLLEPIRITQQRDKRSRHRQNAARPGSSPASCPSAPGCAETDSSNYGCVPPPTGAPVSLLPP